MDNLKIYLEKIEIELFNTIIKYKDIEDYLEIEYIIPNNNVDINYIESIYNDYRHLYVFKYNYEKINENNNIIYLFKITFIK